LAWTAVSATVVTMRMCHAGRLSSSLRTSRIQRATSVLLPAGPHAAQTAAADLTAASQEQEGQMSTAFKSPPGQPAASPNVTEERLAGRSPAAVLTESAAQGCAWSLCGDAWGGRGSRRVRDCLISSSRRSPCMCMGRPLSSPNKRRRQLRGGNFRHNSWKRRVRPSRSCSGHTSGCPVTTSSLNSFSTVKTRKAYDE
jgi:hypothetical protein